MALTKVTGQVIKDTTNVTVGILTVTNTLAVGGTVSIAGTITYEDVTNVDSVGLITARAGVVVGSGITLSKDGDGFFTGVVTATSYSGDGSGLTGLAAGGAFVKGVVGVTTLTPVGIETSTVTRKDLIGPAGNTSTGAGSSFHGAYMGDGFLSFNTEFSNPTGYYISTFTNALVCGPMQLGTTLSIDGTFTIV